MRQELPGCRPDSASFQAPRLPEVENAAWVSSFDVYHQGRWLRGQQASHPSGRAPSSEPGRGFVTTAMLIEAAEGTAQIDSASGYAPPLARHAESVRAGQRVSARWSADRPL